MNNIYFIFLNDKENSYYKNLTLLKNITLKKN